MTRLPQKLTLLIGAMMIASGAFAAAAAGGVGPKLAGVWEITGTPDPGGCGPTEAFENIVVISTDGSITNVDPNVGTGVGDAYRQKGNTYVLGFFGYLTPPGLILRYEIQGTAELVDPGTFHGKFRAIVQDTAGAIPDCVYEGTVVGERLVPMPY